jgi:hypothetical protein
MSAIERSEPTPRTAQRDETVLLEWTVHLLRQNPRHGWIIAGAMLTAALLGFILFFSALLAGVGALLVLFASAEYLLPIRYRLTTERASVSYGLAQLEMRWSGVKRILEGPDAFRLSPFAKESRLDAMRGVTLRWIPDSAETNRDALYRIIKEQVAAHRPVPEKSDG